MNHVSLGLALVLLGLAGCSDSTLVGLEEDPDQAPSTEAIVSSLTMYQGEAPLAVANPHMKGTQVERRIKIRAAGTLMFVPDAPACGGFILVLIQGEGIASHLGAFDLHLSYCSDGNNPVSPILGTQTAANGDQLYTALVGAGVDTDRGPYQDYIYYGGSGRFGGATGGVRLYGYVDYQNLVWSNQGGGTVTY